MYLRSLKKCTYNRNNRPESWQEFERLVRDCAELIFKKEFRLFGGNGHKQYGIDIFSRDWSILIQCKDYAKASDLIKIIDGDYETAKAHFREDGKPFFKQYIIATTLLKDSKVQEHVRKLGPDTDVWFWDDICDIIAHHKIHNDSDQFVAGFEETLFLHRDKPGGEQVSLKNLFVLQEYRELGKNGQYGVLRNDLENRLDRFICEDKYKLLIVEGDAGSGKSSLVGWLNYMAKIQSDSVIEVAEDQVIRRQIPTDRLFSGRTLLTVRLRDLRRNLKKNGCELSEAILEYLNLKEGTFSELFPGAVIVLDGFDELCMINGLTDYEYLIHSFCSWVPAGCKTIITTRPNYINLSQLHDFYCISLQHFSVSNRSKWLEKYQALVPEGSELLSSKVVDYIRTVRDNSVTNICDTPLTLYLLVGSKATFEMTKNLWALYHHIFSKAIVETEYSSQMRPESGTAHSMGTRSSLIYQITEQIADKMHCAEPNDPDITMTGDGRFLITKNGVRNAIKELEKNNEFNMRMRDTGLETQDLSRGHALCCYWKTGIAKGGAEFYHNNIRDFFLCEKIFREVNTIYSAPDSDNDKIARLANLFVGLFKRGALSETTCNFMRERARYDVDYNIADDFPLLEKAQRCLPELYEHMLTNGLLYDALGVENHVQAIENILRGTAQIYRYTYEPILEEGEHIEWWTSLARVHYTRMIDYIFRRLIREIGFSGSFGEIELCGADFNGADLRNVDMHDALLFGADLRGAKLCSANLCSAVLRAADLRSADMHSAIINNAFLHDADLSHAILSGTELKGADLRNSRLMYADLRNADLHSANLSTADLRHADLSDASLFDADLHDSDMSYTVLRGADLSAADLRGTNLRGSDLRGAILRGNVCSLDQEQQITYLKSLNINGLRI